MEIAGFLGGNSVKERSTVLKCATKTGAEIMGRGSDSARWRRQTRGHPRGAGDSTKNIALLQDRKNILAVLQGDVLKAGKLVQRMEVPLPARRG